MDPTNPQYYTHATDRVTQVAFLADRPLQSAELNTVDKITRGKHSRVAEAVFTNGDVIEGVQPRVLTDDPDGNIFISAGRFYLKGDVENTTQTKLQIPFDTRVGVGIRYREYQVSYLDDLALRNPAVGTSTYQEPGADRIKNEWQWGWVAESGAEDAAADDHDDWEFFSIFTVDHGVILLPADNGVGDKTVELIARYDRESHGNYVVRGCLLKFVERLSTTNYFSLEEGLANIFGFKIERLAATRIGYADDFTTEPANFESKVFTPDGDGKARLYANRVPISEITQLVGRRSETSAVTRGLAAGGSDELPRNSIAQVISVSQGATTYTEGVDFSVVGDDINWSLPGVEPAVGSSYNVTYHYLDNVTPLSVTNTYVEVNGLVAGSTVTMSYTRKLPRVDLVVLTQNNSVERILGQAQGINPQPPNAANNQIALATISNDWVNPPVVRNVATHNVPYDDIVTMRNGIVNLFDLFAQLELKHNLTAQDPSTKAGVFVDPLYDDDRRDQGITQTGAIVDQALCLPITPTLLALPDNNDGLLLLDYTHEVVIEQPAKTGCMQINPYMAFEPIPAKVTLNPSIDNWSVVNSVWTSPETTYFSYYVYDPKHRTTGVFTSQKVNVLAEETKVAEFLRQITVNFTVKGFIPGETLATATFGGKTVTPA